MHVTEINLNYCACVLFLHQNEDQECTIVGVYDCNSTILIDSLVSNKT